MLGLKQLLILLYSPESKHHLYLVWKFPFLISWLVLGSRGRTKHAYRQTNTWNSSPTSVKITDHRLSQSPVTHHTHVPAALILSVPRPFPTHISGQMHIKCVISYRSVWVINPVTNFTAVAETVGLLTPRSIQYVGRLYCWINETKTTNTTQKKKDNCYIYLTSKTPPPPHTHTHTHTHTHNSEFISHNLGIVYCVRIKSRNYHI